MIETLEIRWFWKFPLSKDSLTWMESLYRQKTNREPGRTDYYLRIPETDCLGIKIREGALEVKRRIGNHLEGSGQPLTLEQWIKLRGDHADGEENLPSGEWIPVTKQRWISWWALSGEHPQPISFANLESPTAQVELAEVLIQGQVYSTLGVEAAGPPNCVAELTFAVARMLQKRESPLDFSPEAQLSYPALLQKWFSER